VGNPSTGLDRDVIWSPDSQQLAFNSTRASNVAGNQNNDVWRMNRDGSNPVRLTVNADTPAPDPFRDYDSPLVWSPDGKEILFASSRTSPTSETTDFFAYRMSAVTGDATGVQSVARVEQFQRCDWTSRPVALRPVLPVPVAPAPVQPTTPPSVNNGVLPRDTKAPSLSLSGIPVSITRAKLIRSGLSVKVKSSEATSLRGTLEATARRASVARFELSIGSKSARLGTGTRTLKLRPSAKLFGAPRRTVTLRVRVEGRDASGNVKIVTRTIKVRRR